MCSRRYFILENVENERLLYSSSSVIKDGALYSRDIFGQFMTISYFESTGKKTGYEIVFYDYA